MMKILDPGHDYYLFEGVGGPELVNPPQRIIFLKNEGEAYLGNVGFHAGVMTQELLRVCIDRTKYLNAQGSCMETELALSAMRQALAWSLVRLAAVIRGNKLRGRKRPKVDTRRKDIGLLREQMAIRSRGLDGRWL